MVEDHTDQQDLGAAVPVQVQTEQLIQVVAEVDLVV